MKRRSMVNRPRTGAASRIHGRSNPWALEAWAAVPEDIGMDGLIARSAGAHNDIAGPSS
jgi:hypothetical protein